MRSELRPGDFEDENRWIVYSLTQEELKHNERAVLEAQAEARNLTPVIDELRLIERVVTSGDSGPSREYLNRVWDAARKEERKLRGEKMRKRIGLGILGFFRGTALVAAAILVLFAGIALLVVLSSGHDDNKESKSTMPTTSPVTDRPPLAISITDALKVVDREQFAEEAIDDALISYDVKGETPLGSSRTKLKQLEELLESLEKVERKLAAKQEVSSHLKPDVLYRADSAQSDAIRDYIYISYHEIQRLEEEVDLALLARREALLSIAHSAATTRSMESHSESDTDNRINREELDIALEKRDRVRRCASDGVEMVEMARIEIHKSLVIIYSSIGPEAGKLDQGSEFQSGSSKESTGSSQEFGAESRDTRDVSYFDLKLESSYACRL
jgi:hypothetical protein